MDKTDNLVMIHVAVPRALRAAVKAQAARDRRTVTQTVQLILIKALGLPDPNQDRQEEAK